jgi:glycosyltransferase involved in cell wall biosynthesis
MAVESCRRVLEPETIYFHYKHLPWGPYWDRIRPFVTLVPVDLVDEVLTADYSEGLVPPPYRYAHHADFIRLDALINYGGVYADIDTLFVRPFPDDLFEAPFVVGEEPPVVDERTGELRPSLCNALLMAERGALFARQWRQRMAGELNGTWNNHSGFLAQTLRQELPGHVRVEPEVTFFPFSPDRDGIADLFERRRSIPAGAVSIHLWAHLWWDRDRRDFSEVHSEYCTPAALRGARTTFAQLARPYLWSQTPSESGTGRPTSGGAHGESSAWHYLSLDETSGYGVAADRCRAALESSGLEIDWTPFVPGARWGLAYRPPSWLDPFGPDGVLRPSLSPDARPQDASHDAGGPTAEPVVVAHLVPEFFPVVRARSRDVFLVGHTAWETDRIPAHWIPCLNAADLIVVPSRFSADAITSSPVTTPVAVVPHVAPTMAPGTGAAREASSAEPFVFYTIAEWTERKAPFKTIEAYLRAFRGGDPVLLIVKTSPRDLRGPEPAGLRAVEPGTAPWSLAQLMRDHPDPAAIRLVTRRMTDAEIAELHRGGDCFVSLCRSEGWGLGAFDAAAHGNPVVTTGFGGHLDYLVGSPYLVDFDLVSVQDPNGFPSYAPDQRWAEPDLEHAAALLRAVVAQRHQAAALAGSLGEEIRRRYRPAAIADAFRSAVDEHYGDRRGRPAGPRPSDRRP